MRLTVHVIPRSSRNSLIWEKETLKVHLTTPPVDGAANEALIALLAQHLKLPKRAISIVQGTTSRQKVVEIADLTLEDIKRRIE